MVASISPAEEDLSNAYLAAINEEDAIPIYLPTNLGGEWLPIPMA